jgi:hypothetical protein
VNYRFSQKLNFNAEYEGASSDKTYFRTSLRDYNQLRARGKFQATSSLLFSGSFLFLDNQNPTKSINFDMRQQLTSLSVQWMPKGARVFSLVGDYSRATYRSDLGYIDPTDFTARRSSYRDNAHIATTLADLNLPAGKDRTVKFSLGGSMFVSAGARPTSYYQPLGRITMPLTKRFQWYGEWRWYGYSETFWVFEEFRTNHFLTGFRLTL